MAREYLWTRGRATVSTTGSRRRVMALAIPEGWDLLERVIATYTIWNQVSTSGVGRTPPGQVDIFVGLRAGVYSSDPFITDADPGSEPDQGWFWAVADTMDYRLRGDPAESVDLGWWNDRNTVDLRLSRPSPDEPFPFVGIYTSPLPLFGDGSSTWLGVAYLQVLQSRRV